MAMEQIKTPGVIQDIQDIEEEQLLDQDETVMERIVGLGEMFPDGLRGFVSSSSSSVSSMVKGGYHYLRVGLWFCSVCTILLFSPAVLEMERLSAQDSIKNDRNKVMLGPGMASG